MNLGRNKKGVLMLMIPINHGLSSDYEKEMGLHNSVGTVRNGLQPEMFARLRNPIAYDCSSLVRNALYDNFGDSAVLTRTTISMMHMHDFFVKNFTY